jgi:hypothetical protein
MHRFGDEHDRRAGPGQDHHRHCCTPGSYPELRSDAPAGQSREHRRTGYRDHEPVEQQAQSQSHRDWPGSVSLRNALRTRSDSSSLICSTKWVSTRSDLPPAANA